MSASQIYLPRVTQAPAFEAGLPTWQCQGRAMGMQWQINWRGGTEELALTLQQQFEASLELVEQQMSHWHDASDLMRFNRAASGWISLPAELLFVLERARFIAQQSGACFNPCLGALVQLWGFGPGSRYRQPDWQIPETAAIDAARAACDWQALQIDLARQSAWQPGGMQLDLSGIAKGYAVDLLAQQLEQHEIRHYLVEFGGELRGAGVRADQQPWWVEIEVPARFGSKPARQLLGLLGLAVASSGDDRQYFEVQGQRYSHTLDGRSGYPINNELVSVSVIHRSCMIADAWASALSVLGCQRGLLMAQQEQLAALFMTTQGELHLSPALQEMVHD